MAYGADLNTTVEPAIIIQQRLENSESLIGNSTTIWSLNTAMTETSETSMTTDVHSSTSAGAFSTYDTTYKPPGTTTDPDTTSEPSGSSSMLTDSSSPSTPWSTTSGPMYTNTTNNVTTTTVEPQGCPEYYSWCSYTPVIYLSQFLAGVACIGVGYPVAQIMSYALYSKILGPKPQAVWMGWLTAAGSAARAIGPVFVTQIYNSYGPRVTFSACCGIILATIIFICIISKRLVPFAVQTKLISPVRN